MSNHTKTFALLIAGCMLFSPAAHAKVADSDMPELTAYFKTDNGLDAGHARMIEGPNGILIKLDLENIAPGPHGLHLHDIGDCTPHGELSENESPFSHASGHFNPNDKQHGFLNPNGSHAGDLPNITVPENGKLTLDVFAHGLALNQSEQMPYLRDADGSAIMIHEGADDYTSDATGNAGPRLACAEIK